MKKIKQKIRRSIFTLCILIYAGINAIASDTIQVKLPQWKEPVGYKSTEILLGFGKTNRAGWGHYSPNERKYFNDALPAIFNLTLVLDSIQGNRGIKWIFTGPATGIYFTVGKNKLELYQQYYDSYGYNTGLKKFPRHPKSESNTTFFMSNETITAITIEMNYKLELIVSLNGMKVYDKFFPDDIRRQQLHLTGDKGVANTRLLAPEISKIKIDVNPNVKYQQMLGWGGIGTPTAYHELSEEGKEIWWQYIKEYNLLCQREYPVGGLLNKSLDNWDDLNYAKAHYYGDNFPNGEVSDFDYNKRIQELGGFVMFEFWDFPAWMKNNEKEYARAMVGYCKEAVEKTGQAPRIVGVQNEVDMSEENVKKFVLELRKALDKAGFLDVKIHMHNASTIQDALQRVKRYTQNPEVWDVIDYSATNMYDFQRYLTNPDAFDSILHVWYNEINTRPFLSPELCINNGKYQLDSYRLAFSMGMLYEKNLTITNAILISYCWTILNTEQPSYGATRSLFFSSPEDGFIPVPSSHQLRVFGAFSRRIKEGMYRVKAETENTDLKVVAFNGDENQATIVLLNRSVTPVIVEINWEGIELTEQEIASPYSPNTVKPFKGNKALVQPGSMITLTNVPLNN